MEPFINYLIQKGHSSATIKHHIHHAEQFISWAKAEDLPLGATRQADILAWANHEKARGLAKKTVNMQLNSLRHYFRMLASEGMISYNPVAQVRIKGETRKLHETLSKEELEEIYLSYGQEAYRESRRGGMDFGRRTWLSTQRNKNLLGMMIYQGLTSGELAGLRPEDLQLREGKVAVPATRRSNERTLKLESHQILDLMEYMLKSREEILELSEKQSEKLFVSIGSGAKLNNTLQKLMQQLKKSYPAVVNHGQIRASVITNWLKIENLRKVQYMAGHRYISSTEAYQENDIEGLLEELETVLGGMNPEGYGLGVDV